MNKQTEALKLALEALECDPLDMALNPDGHMGFRKDQAITAIKEALMSVPDGSEESSGTEQPPCKTGSQCTSKCEQCRYKHDCDKAEQPAQEPVAWMDGYRNIYSLEEKAAGCAEATIALVPMANQEKTSGSPINELQCVCGAVWLGEEMVHLPDKRPPASKPWVGLTEQERNDLEDYCEMIIGKAAFEAIEAKLKEKNA